MLVRVIIAAVAVGVGLIVGGRAGAAVAVVGLVVAAWPKRRYPVVGDADD